MATNYKVLGINFGGHDTSASLMIDGIPIACCEEERYTKVKHARTFPVNAIKDALKKGNINNINELDEIAIACEPSVLRRSSTVSKLRRSLPSKVEYSSLLKEHFGYEGKISTNLHHLCHIASAYYPSGFEEALLISNDGVGEVGCSLVATGKKGEIKVLHSGNQWPNSVGLVYTAITVYLGWKPHYDEGIVMGLAPYGDDTKIVPGTKRTYREIFEEIIFEVGDYDYEVNPYWMCFHRVRDRWVSENFEKVFGKRRSYGEPMTDVYKNVARAMQYRLETIAMNQLRRAKKETGLNKLCISGGVGLNCSLNGIIEQSGLFEEIFVQPASGDSGTALGACYLSTRAQDKKYVPQKWLNFYLGSSFSNEYVEGVLKEKGLSYQVLNEDYSIVAKHLSDGKIVGWFQEGAEFGPRALGNRSILCSPFPASMKDYINARVKFREEFRPFAPMVLREHARNYFEISQDSPHMLIATKVKKEKRNKIPAVVHVDNSARIQTVSADNNAKCFDLLKSFYKRTECPVLLNTSFNVKGQPIVNDPEDAIGCFMSTNIDVLVIGDFMLTKGE